MSRRTAVRLLAVASVAACTKPQPATLEPEGGYPRKQVDSRPLVPEVTSLNVEPTPGGVVIEASGRIVPGYWDLDLVPAVVQPAGEILLEFRARPPLTEPTGVQAPSQTVYAGYFVKNADLAGVRTITVIGANGSRSRSR